MTSSLFSSIGNILGSLSGSFGGGTSVKKSKALMEYQDQLARNSFQWKNENGWKFMREGLINADYNPLLAIGQSPIDSQMASATASQPTGSIDGASSMQAQTAKKMSDSQIMVNKATASKTAEEALTQQNIRSNYDSQTMMNMLTSERIKKLLPYEQRKMMAETLVAHSMVGLNNANAAAAPRLAGAAETSANAAKTTAETGKEWTPKKIGAGVALGALSTVGALYGPAKFKALKALGRFRPVGFK